MVSQINTLNRHWLGATVVFTNGLATSVVTPRMDTMMDGSTMYDG